ncbi:MAG: hypothetical protein ACREV4_11335 [Gammaproteobacteria bacterium]
MRQATRHFYTVYKNIDELKFHFNQQLDKLAASGFVELKWDKGEAAAPNGSTYLHSRESGYRSDVRAVEQ